MHPSYGLRISKDRDMDLFLCIILVEYLYLCQLHMLLLLG
jgi:hypothetical protein